MNQVHINSTAYSGPGINAGGTVVKDVVSFSIDLNLGNVSVITDDNQVFNFTVISPVTITVTSGIFGSANITIQGD